MTKTILFIHQNYPAQFGKLAKFLVTQGWNVYYATAREEFKTNEFTTYDGVKIIKFESNREPTEGIHPYIAEAEKAVINAQAFGQLGVKLKKNGVNPDIVVAHSGWGSGSFTKAIWPDTKFVQYLEWWYTSPSRDSFQAAPEEARAPHERVDSLMRNVPFMIDANSADGIICPTEYQAADIPDYLRPKLKVMFDGVDTDFFSPHKFDDIEIGGVKIKKKEKILTYATRGMEPQRGFPEFMEALSILQKKRKNFTTIIAGAETVHYSAGKNSKKNYKKEMLEKFSFDHDRLHFVGRLPYEHYRNLLQRSDAHVYFTRPFVTSWSFFEAASTGCALVTSNFDNVREVLPRDNMASFVDHRDIDSVVKAIDGLITNLEKGKKMGLRARNIVERKYASSILYPEHEQYFLELINPET